MAENSTGISVSFGGTAFGELLDCEEGDIEVKTLETTHHGSTADSNGNIAKTFIAGKVIDNGQLVLTLALDTSTDVVLGDTGAVVITYPNADTTSFSAILVKAGKETKFEDLMKRTITFQVTGPIT